jgi:hypothetical protein
MRLRPASLKPQPPWEVGIAVLGDRALAVLDILDDMSGY